MKLLLDEPVSPTVAEQLREMGHDVRCVRDLDLQEVPDPDVLVGATRDKMAAVTRNHQDLRPLHAAYLTSGRRHCGLILVARAEWLHGRGLGLLINALDRVLRAHPRDDDLVSTEIWLSAG